MLQIDTLRGKVFYSSELIKGIIAMSTMECEGVIGLANCNVKDGVYNVLNGNINNGVKVNVENKKLQIDVFVIVKYGIKVSVIANDIIQKIKSNIENYIGVQINSITVNVQGIELVD